MAKNKIKEAEIKNLQEIVGKLNQSASQLGNLEMQKHHLLHASQGFQQNLEEAQNSLKETYGQVNINLQDGSYVVSEKN